MKNYEQATFLISAAKLEQLPSDTGAEVAFAGRSNAGKSSALNTLTRQHRLARVSKTPGRTQLINMFELEGDARIIDLPGYGFAKVPDRVKAEWAKLIDDYLTQRKCLKGLVLVMDIRHPLKPFDLQMLEWSDTAEMPIHIILTKADKLKSGAAKNSLLQVKKEIAQYPFASVQLFSSLKKLGIGELKKALNVWFGVRGSL